MPRSRRGLADGSRRHQSELALLPYSDRAMNMFAELVICLWFVVSAGRCSGGTKLELSCFLYCNFTLATQHAVIVILDQR